MRVSIILHNCYCSLWSGTYWNKVYRWTIYLSLFWFSNTSKCHLRIRCSNKLSYWMNFFTCATFSFRSLGLLVLFIWPWLNLVMLDLFIWISLVGMQSRVLSYGIAGAIIFRLSIILLGSVTLQVVSPYMDAKYTQRCSCSMSPANSLGGGYC